MSTGLKWAIAIVGVAGLATLTVTTQMPWLARPQPSMEGAKSGSSGGHAGEAGPALSCPVEPRVGGPPRASRASLAAALLATLREPGFHLSVT